MSKTTPKDVFLHLLSMVTLYISVISAVVLLFKYVDTAFPDAVRYYSQSGTFSAMRSAIASLIVAWPIFICVNRFIQKEYKQIPAKKGLGIRKWLTYLTLFVAAIVIIVNLIMLIFNFLDGELTTAFVLKTISILAIIGSVFTYYTWDIKHSETKGAENKKLLAWVSSIAVIVAIVSGFFVMGSPAKQRAVRLDEQRIQHLVRIQNEVIAYWQDKEALPASLEDLSDSLSSFESPADPITDKAYVYEVADELRFRLCATFETESTESPVEYDYYYYSSAVQSNWTHGSGYSCFERTIDPERFQIDKPVMVR